MPDVFEELDFLKMVNKKIQQSLRILTKIQERKKAAFLLREWKPGYLTDILNREKDVISICKQGLKAIKTLQGQVKNVAVLSCLTQFLESAKTGLAVWEEEYSLWKDLNTIQDPAHIPELKQLIAAKQKQEQLLAAKLNQQCTETIEHIEEAQTLEFSSRIAVVYASMISFFTIMSALFQTLAQK